MNKLSKESSFLKYFLIVFSMMFVVLLYVWQNIEVMQIKLDYRKVLRLQESLIRDNDRLLAEIERYKNMEYIENFVSAEGMVPVTPDRFGTIKIKE